MAILMLLSGLLASQRQVAMISEMIHSASLIHDDVVDQADFRRGKPSVNVLWNHKKVSVVCIGNRSALKTLRFF
jgi:geranylgeranyl pyrophosphate synthase